MKRSIVSSLSVLTLAAAVPSAGFADAAPVRHVRGTIASVDHDRVTVTTAHGPVIVTLGAKTRYAGVVPGSVSDITTGTFVGTANVPGPGAARALEVVVFPKAMAGTGEGDYAWDLPASGGSPASSMTNGHVMAPRTSAMTNATVTHATSGSTKTLTLSYKGGTKIVAIPPGTPIVRVVPGTRALVVTGAHVFVAPPLTAAGAVIVGERGATPPM